MQIMMRKICILVSLLLFCAACREASDLKPKKYTRHSKRSWSEAQTYCRTQYNADLVTIRDETENQDFVYDHGWIGLYREDTDSKWKWSRRDEVAKFTNWHEGYPKAGENCAFKRKDGKTWESAHCNDSRSTMCYEEMLVLVKEKKTWEQALEHCRALEAVNSSQPASAYQNHRYDLATLLTPDDHVFAREKAQEATTYAVWTGLRFLAGEWLWVSGRGEVDYQGIKSCPNLRSCGVLVKNGTKFYGIRDCMLKRNFLCSKKP